MSEVVDLPDIDGSLAVGISAGAEELLLPTQFLKIPQTMKTMQNAYACAINSANEIYISLNINDSSLHMLMINGAYCAIKFDLCRLVSNVNDGDWMYTADDITTLIPKELFDMITIDHMRHALTVILSTKVSYWLCNHHTGGKTLTGYPRKVAGMFYPGSDIQDLTRVVHITGHWVSTIYCLSLLSINGLRNTVSAITLPHVVPNIIVERDMSMRIMSLPSGTHKHAACIAAAKSLAKHPLLKLFNYTHLIVDLHSTHMKISANPIIYHIGSYYLSHNDRATFDDDVAPIGLMGSYLRNIMAKSTLAKSPCFMKNTTWTYAEHATYDATWDSICSSYAQVVTAAHNKDEILAVIRHVAGKPSLEMVNRVRIAFGYAPLDEI